jgi:HEPN domain-containing protein
MANRAQDWLAQARHDIDHARHALDDGDYEGACFAAQQGAEKAVRVGVRLALLSF